MRVLLISLDGAVTDTTSDSFKRIKEYATLVDELHVFVFYKNRESTRMIDNESRINANNLYIYKFSASIFGLLKALFFGRRLVREKHIDVVGSQDPFETGLLGFLITKFAQSHSPDRGTVKAGLNVQLHGDFYGNPYWLAERLLNHLRWHLGIFVLRKAQSIRVVSERIKTSLNSLFLIPNSKIINVPIWTDVDYFKNAKPNFDLKTRYSQFNFIILAVANLVSVKNLEFLIKAMKKLHEILPRAGLIIVGDGKLRKSLQLTAYGLQLRDFVIFEGSQTDLVSYYKGSDCFALVSKYEGWGRAVVEAAASGLPVVMTDVGLAGEIIKNEESGVILKDFNQDDLVRALSQIYFNQNLREKLIAGAQTTIQKLPTKQATLEAIKQSWEMARLIR